MDTQRAEAKDHIARQLEEARQRTRWLLEKAFRNWDYPIRHQLFCGSCAPDKRG
jgi:hypothetical protein